MKQVPRLLSLLVLTAALAVIAGTACKNSGAPERTWKAGAFLPTSANIQSYSLPANVTIDTLCGYEDLTDTLESDHPLYMVVTNSQSSDVNFTLPAGLVFQPNTAGYEYMMLLKDYTFTATGSGMSNARLPTYGCNDSTLDEPNGDSHYSIVGKEWDKETQKLLDVMVGHTIPDSLKELVQQGLDEVTYGDSLTDSTKTQLSNLP